MTLPLFRTLKKKQPKNEPFLSFNPTTINRRVYRNCLLWLLPYFPPDNMISLIFYVNYFHFIQEFLARRLSIMYTASSIAQWYSTGFECRRSRVQSPVKDPLLDSLVVQCWLRVWQVPGSISSQGPRHTKDVIKMVPVFPMFSTEHSEGKILALSQ